MTVSPPPPRRHPIYWFDDALLILRVEDILFKIHGSLLGRHSPIISNIISEASFSKDFEGCKYNAINPDRHVNVEDFVVLLEHLYHDKSLMGLPRVASILRISSPKQLDFVDLHEHSRRLFENLLPSALFPLEMDLHPDHLPEALAVATGHDITSVQKRLFYALVASSHFEAEEEQPSSEAIQPVSTPSALSPADTKRCKILMSFIISHFTPILFTPPATSHMACTDVFADAWMSLVIQPALGDDGVYKPLETLERIKGIDWGTHGLCSSCLQDKKDEWTEEQETIWRLMDEWLRAPIGKVV